MNGVAAGVVAGILLLIAAVVGIMSENTWNNAQQSSVQTYTQQQINGAEGTASGSGS